MIKYLIQNPHKWQELELFRFLHSFDTEYDKSIIDYLNNPSNENAFIKGLTPLHRSHYETLQTFTYNDDNELLDECYLTSERSMLNNTSFLISRVQKELLNKDVFESLDDIIEGASLIRDNAIIETKDYYQDWAESLELKINGDFKIIESKILTNVPFLPSELSIIAARPSMGKTALALSVLLELSKEHKVLFISSEMPVPRIIDRLVSYYTQIATRKITQGKLNSYEISQCIEALTSIKDDENIILEYSDNMRGVKRIISNTECDLVAIDYLQLIKAENTKTDRRLQIAEMSRDFKRIAVQKNIPVLLLAQINRESTKTVDKRPNLTSLAESASIEQDSDNVVFIHRPTYYLSEELKNEMTEDELSETEYIIAKQRDGQRGVEKGVFLKGRFYALPKDEPLSGENDSNTPF
jgi:hypothetical protein